MGPEQDAAVVRDRIAGALDQVSTLARLVTTGFAVVVVLLVLVLGGLLRVTTDTRGAVKDRAVLEDRNTELEAEVAQLTDVNGQAVDWIVALSEQIVSLGGDPPEIVLRPSTTEPG